MATAAAAVPMVALRAGTRMNANTLLVCLVVVFRPFRKSTRFCLMMPTCAQSLQLVASIAKIAASAWRLTVYNSLSNPMHAAAAAAATRIGLRLAEASFCIAAPCESI